MTANNHLKAETIERKIQAEQTSPVAPIRMSVTRRDLDFLGGLIAWKYDRAINQGCDVAAREYGRQLEKLAAEADMLL